MSDEPNPELEALWEATLALAKMPKEAHPRALAYLWDRFITHPSPSSPLPLSDKGLGEE